MNTISQLELFDSPTIPQKQPRTQKRNVHNEAKAILDSAGYSEWSNELKALVAATLMAQYFPAQHKIMMQMLATTSIKTS